MDIISAYVRQALTVGAAVISGTTHKTVKRVITRHEAGGGAPPRSPRSVTTTSWRTWSLSGWEDGGPDLGEAAAARSPRRGYAGSPAEFPAGWSRRRSSCGGRGSSPAAPPGGVVTGEHLVIDWAASAAACVLRGPGGEPGAVRAVAADERAEPRWRAGGVLRGPGGCRGRCWPTGWAPEAGWSRMWWCPHRKSTAVRGALRVPARFSARPRPGVEGMWKPRSATRAGSGRAAAPFPDPGRQRAGRGMVRRGQRRDSQRDLRGAGGAAGHQRSCGALPSLRASHRAAGDPQGRPALVRAVRFGALSVPTWRSAPEVGCAPTTRAARDRYPMGGSSRATPGGHPAGIVRDEHYGRPAARATAAARPEPPGEGVLRARGPVAEAFIPCPPSS